MTLCSYTESNQRRNITTMSRLCEGGYRLEPSTSKYKPFTPSSVENEIFR